MRPANEMALHCNAISHRLAAYTEWSLLCTYLMRWVLLALSLRAKALACAQFLISPPSHSVNLLQTSKVGSTSCGNTLLPSGNETHANFMACHTAMASNSELVMTTCLFELAGNTPQPNKPRCSFLKYNQHYQYIILIFPNVFKIDDTNLWDPDIDSCIVLQFM